MKVCNTENKVYNVLRRSYIGESDLKEGESICKKCNGCGQNPLTGDMIDACPKCLGKGIVDWVSQATEQPRVSMTGKFGSSSMYLGGNGGTSGSSGINGTSIYAKYYGWGGSSGPHIPLPNNGMVVIKKVTK